MDDDYSTLESSYARSRVSAAAIILMVLCLISIVLLFLALPFDAWLLLSGRARRMSSGDTPVVIRMLWSFLILVANIVTLAGAWRMKQLRNLALARAACILALLPCLGPCLLFGIPFGIWGLVVLNDRQVRESFED